MRDVRAVQTASNDLKIWPLSPSLSVSYYFTVDQYQIASYKEVATSRVYLPIALGFINFYTVMGVFGVRYDVTVITDPPHGPFLIDNRIDFTCHVHPMPPEPVTYSWHAVIDASGPSTLSGQNTTFTPYEWHLHFSWFLCKVFSNETLIGVGRRLVEIHGKTCTIKLKLSTEFS